MGGEMLDTMNNRRIAGREPQNLGNQLAGRELTPEQQAHPIVQQAQVARMGSMFAPAVSGLEDVKIPLNGHLAKTMAGALNRKAGTKLSDFDIAKGMSSLFGKGTHVTESELRTFLEERLPSFKPSELDDIMREATQHVKHAPNPFEAPKPK